VWSRSGLGERRCGAEPKRISDIGDQISGSEEKRDGNTEITEIGTQRAQRTARRN
jgi:hypothetical protein